jgi:hypothetical protein
MSTPQALAAPAQLPAAFLRDHGGDNHWDAQTHQAAFPDGRVGSDSALATAQAVISPFPLNPTAFSNSTNWMSVKLVASAYLASTTSVVGLESKKAALSAAGWLTAVLLSKLFFVA